MVPPSLHVLLLHLGLFAARGLTQDDNDANTLGPFNRAAYWEATTIGDYIYIDGGQMSIKGSKGKAVGPFQVNHTLSIDCSIPWRPEDVEIRLLNRSSQIPALSDPCIFPTADSFYIWGGDSPENESPEELRLWQFTADGHGAGDWDYQSVGNADAFGSIPYRESAACTSTEGRAFAFGGTTIETIEEESTRLGSQSTGLVTFDFYTRTFEEEDEGDDGYEGNYSGDGSVWGGTTTFVPNFGDEGVIVMIGGETRRGQANAAYRDMMSVSVYDVAGKKWHAQQARLGDATDPPPRVSHHCAVGVADTAEGNSFEIFIYGGNTNTQSYSNYGGTYVLSLPSFTWTKATDMRDGLARSHHACVSLNSSSSQFVSLGGVQVMAEETNWEDKDPFPQSIGIYDMNNLTWVESYDPAADAYVTNSKIRSWSHDTPRWSSNELRDLFLKHNNNNNDNDNDNNDNNGAGDEDEDSSDLTIALAVGVVGGLAALVVLAGLASWFWRPRRQQSGSVKSIDPPSIEVNMATPPKLTLTPPPTDHK
jgi:hypothetical protein